MKKSILIFCSVLMTVSLMAFSYMTWDNTTTNQAKTSCNQNIVFDNHPVNFFNNQNLPDLFYKVDSRFVHTITKEELHKAKSITDIVPHKATQFVEIYETVTVAVLEGNDEVIELGDNPVLNIDQIKLLQTTDYSNNIYVRADFKKKNPVTGILEDEYLIYYITIIPEREAEFTTGYETLLEYLKENSKEKVAIIQENQLRPGKVSFTVTKKGTISDVKLNSTSGYPSVDKELIKLIRKMPKKWKPATNSKGKKVDQEFVFFFGLEGC